MIFKLLSLPVILVLFLDLEVKGVFFGFEAGFYCPFGKLYKEEFRIVLLLIIDVLKLSFIALVIFFYFLCFFLLPFDFSFFDFSSRTTVRL